MTYFVIGPSHIANDMIERQIGHNSHLFDDMILHGEHGLLNWSVIVLNNIKSALEQNKMIVWIVSNYKLNNLDYDKLLLLLMIIQHL